MKSFLGKAMWAFGLFVLVALVATTAAHALSFTCITNNSTANCSTGEAQLSVTLATGPGAGQVQFTFTNSGPNASSITDVYFDDGTLLGIASITNGAGVSFSQGASPGDLPGGNPVGFEATAGFLADSDPPTQPNGVNGGETLTIVFNLINGQTFQDTLNALGEEDPRLRIGVHVQGFANGGSESFVCCDPETHQVPEASTLLLFGAGLVTLSIVGRRFSRKRQELSSETAMLPTRD